MCSAMLLLGNRLKKCGSIDVTSAATAIFNSSAAAEAASTMDAATASAAASRWNEAKRRMETSGRMGTDTTSQRPGALGVPGARRQSSLVAAVRQRNGPPARDR